MRAKVVITRKSCWKVGQKNRDIYQPEHNINTWRLVVWEPLILTNKRGSVVNVVRRLK